MSHDPVAYSKVLLYRGLIHLPPQKKGVFKNFFVTGSSDVPFFIVMELLKDVYYTDVVPSDTIIQIFNGIPPVADFVHLDYQGCRNSLGIRTMETHLQNATAVHRPFVLMVYVYHEAPDKSTIEGSVSSLLRYENI